MWRSLPDPAHRLQRVRDHFIFSVESTGALPAAELVRRAIVTLNEKIGDVLDAFTPVRTRYTSRNLQRSALAT